jgi:dTDP-4-dehydrorhamnose reductase
MSETLLVLGHRGMLGNAVLSYFKSEGFEVLTTESRWGEESFAHDLVNTRASYIINCIGAIPQKKLGDEAYTSINVELPKFLETLGKKIIHPTTDCEFSGTLEEGKKYTKNDKRDAEDSYGKSKALISELIEKTFNNTKMIRVSIIGHELTSSVSFLDWFLSSEGEVNGYANHSWNGITTLEWAKNCRRLINDWESFPTLTQLGTEDVMSKFEILCLTRTIYNKDVVIKEVRTEANSNKTLLSDFDIPDLADQLRELKKFYNK